MNAHPGDHDGQAGTAVLLDTADPTTYVTLSDEGLPATFLDLDAQEALGIAPEPMTAPTGLTTSSKRPATPVIRSCFGLPRDHLVSLGGGESAGVG